MSLKLIIILVIVLAIYVGSLEQMRAVLRRPTNNNKGALEARRNTLTGDLAALSLGIKQVQGYIQQINQANQTDQTFEGRANRSPDAQKAAVQAQASLDLASTAKKELDSSLPVADSNTALQICDLKLAMARFHIRNARALLLPHIIEDDDEQQS